MKLLRIAFTLYFSISLISCAETDEIYLDNSALFEEVKSLDYSSVKDLNEKLKDGCDVEIKSSSNGFVSYRQMKDSLYSFVRSGQLRTQDEAIAFIENNSLYFDLRVDEVGELYVVDYLEDSPLQDHLNFKGEININNEKYVLTTDFLSLNAGGSQLKINTQLQKENDTPILESIVMEPGDIDDNGSGCFYWSYPTDLGCRNGWGQRTVTNGDKRIKYWHEFQSNVCGVNYTVQARPQNRFLRIWWADNVTTYVYMKIKVNYILADGTEGETIRELRDHYNSYAYPRWGFEVVPQSTCSSNGTSRCYQSSDSHYTVDGYWFWVSNFDGSVTSPVISCDPEDLCTTGNFGCLNTSNQREYFAITPCEDCSPDEICMFGSCWEIIL